MKIRTLIVTILGVLVVSGVSPAQDMDAPQPQLQEPAFLESTSPTRAQPEPSLVAQTVPTTTPQAPKMPSRLAKPKVPTTPTATRPPMVRTPSAASEGPTQVEIFELRHASAVDMSNLISSVLGIRVAIDGRLNRLIVSATKEQIQAVENLITAMDVEGPEASTSRGVQNFVYRIYMFEIPSGDEDMKPFSMSLDTTEQVPPQQLLEAAAEKDVQISEFRQIDKGPRSDVLIQGRATSYESLRRMVEKLPESNIDELLWGDNDAEAFTSEIEAAQHWQLPDDMQKHIGKFLGDDIRTVGYWFGNLSVPGVVVAPIGPWRLKLKLNAESDRMLELGVDVEVPDEMRNFDRRFGRQQSDVILSNTIRVKIGKPIIIGYNRESYGTRKMGAMVILPEEDTAIESF